MMLQPPVVDYRSPPTEGELPQEKIAKLRRAELIIILCLMALPAILLLGLGGLALYMAYVGSIDIAPKMEVGWWCLAIGSCFAAVAIYAAIRLRRKVH